MSIVSDLELMSPFSVMISCAILGVVEGPNGDKRHRIDIFDLYYQNWARSCVCVNGPYFIQTIGTPPC